MYLKKLSIQGFKSFANRTSFDFGGGVTAVVGPNGSGKSNVSDAIRWVLGEQSSKLLRAKKTEDVIFSGSPGRPAVGMAEVMLTLDNSERWLPLDFAEIEVGRRVYRNGDSEYLLNGARVRLRDVLDLLMKGDVGQNSYAIMGQGLVDEVLSMTPDDRRSFLDEAADVKRFRVKIREAQDRLSATRDNMERVGMLVAEIEPRLAQLSRQAERASEHQKLAAELSELLRAWYGHRWSEAQNSLVRARAALDQRTAEDATAVERVEELRTQLRALSEEIRKRRETIARRESRDAELEQRTRQLEQEIALDRERHAMVSARHDELVTELEAIESERVALASTDIDDGRRGIAVVEELDGARAALTERRAALETVERDYASARSKVQELRDGAEADKRRAVTSEEDAAAAGKRIEQLERELAQAGITRKQLLVELIGYGRRFAELRETLIAAEDRLEDARLETRHAREHLLKLQDEVQQYENAGNTDLRELDRLEGRLEALRRVQLEHESVTAGTRNVLVMGQALIEGVAPGSLGEAPELSGVVGLIARQITVPAGLEAAINAALELRLHAVIVEKEDQAFEAIRLLIGKQAGRAQFLPLDTLRHVFPLNLQKERGVVGVASKLVKCDTRYRPLVDTLLGRVIVCEDVATGLQMIRRGLGSVVTVDGVAIEQNGIISGGATSVEETVFSRQREYQELPAKIAALRERTQTSAHQLETARAAIEQAAARSREAEQAYDRLRKQFDASRFELEKERDRLHRLRRELGGYRGKRADIGREIEARQRLIDQARLAADQARARATERTAGLAALEEELAHLTGRREAALQGVGEASAALASVEGERRTLDALREQHEKTIERLANQVAAKRLQARNIELEATVIADRLQKLARDHEAALADRARQGDDVAPDRDELDRFEAHERQVQEELAGAQEALLAIDRRRIDAEAEVARALELIETLKVEMDREGLAPDRRGNVVPLDAAMAAEVMFDDEPAMPPYQGAALLDPEATRLRVEELRRQIRRLGPINEEAPVDYEESRQRYEFLTTQTRDLEEAELHLREAISELNEEIRDRFAGAFDKVNAAFGEYFAAFFGGGSARLIMTDPKEVASTGIEIEAQPPGKRVNSLTLLSGGERSLTAVALLFALLSANPAPFCVLDEVDAALDEANVGRFTEALAKLSERTQFLVVTHNRRTVEVANSIYGVSMARDGVSKVLSLRLSDIPQN